MDPVPRGAVRRHLQVTGDGQDLVLADGPFATVLYDRDPVWGNRPNAPFNR